MLRRGFNTPGEIGKFLQMEKSTLSRNLDRMRNSGWLEILQGENGRSQRLQMTPQGKKVVEQSLPLWRAAQKEAKQILGEHGAASVCETADSVWAEQSGS
jgi:DNA-binding MarR family transcriptional regulator